MNTKWSFFRKYNYFVLLGIMFLIPSLTSQAGLQDIDLPHSPKKWINGGPYAQEALKNKTVVFYFFEED